MPPSSSLLPVAWLRWQLYGELCSQPAARRSICPCGLGGQADQTPPSDHMQRGMPALLLGLCLLTGAAAYPPVVVETIANVILQGGVSFSYQFKSTLFRSNKAGGVLLYTLRSSDGASLPDWINFDAPSRTISGSPPGGADVRYSWTLSAADRDGESSSGTFQFIINEPCSAGLYRHFRLKISITNDWSWYDASPVGGSSGRSAICSIAWQNAHSKITSFPNAAGLAAYNFSGYTYKQNSSWFGTREAAPITAFQQLADADCDVSGPFNRGNSWLVRMGCSSSRLGMLPAQLWSCDLHKPSTHVYRTGPKCHVIVIRNL